MNISDNKLDNTEKSSIVTQKKIAESLFFDVY